MGVQAKKLDRWKQISDAYATQLNAEKNHTKVRQTVQEMCEEMRLSEGFGNGSSKSFCEGDCEELQVRMAAPLPSSASWDGRLPSSARGLVLCRERLPKPARADSGHSFYLLWQHAAESLFDSRRVVKFTYVREFLLEKQVCARMHTHVRSGHAAWC